MKFLCFHLPAFLLLNLFSSGVTGAQGCRFDIPLDQKVVDGIVKKINPGDTICLAGGNRAEIYFKNLSGTKQKPIVIINKDEKVVINTKEGRAISFGNSIHFRLTGTGGPDNYGIEIASSGIQGVEVNEFSSDVEIDHLEIHNVGFAGIMAKTDPDCFRRDLRFFTMKNLIFHHNYIYDTRGEGFYVGYSWYPSRETSCDGVAATFYSHAIHGVRIYDNIIKDTQWDGLQVGSSPSDVKIFSNSISNYGLANELYQNHAVQIGAGTTGDFFNNMIDTGTGGGISFFGSGNNNLYNNIIINTGEQAIYHNDRYAHAGTTYHIVNNTIIHPEGAAIWLNAANTSNNMVVNNLIVLEKDTGAIVNSGSRWLNESNIVFKNLEEVRFKDPENLDYRLTLASSAVDAGSATKWIQFDYGMGARPANDKYDVGAYEHGAPPYHQPQLNLKKSLSATGFKLNHNPADDAILISVPKNHSARRATLTLYNGEGKVVAKKKAKIRSGESSLKTRNLQLSAGVYYLHFESGDGKTELFRIVKNQ